MPIRSLNIFNRPPKLSALIPSDCTGEWMVSDTLNFCNPSITRFNGKLFCLQRIIHPGPETNAIGGSSENVMLELSSDLKIMDHYKLDDSDLRSKIEEARCGLEDGRLFVWGSGLWVLFSGYHKKGPKPFNTMVLCRVQDRVLTEPKVIASPRSAVREKNWMPWPIGDRIFFIYSTSPLEIYEYSLDRGLIPHITSNESTGLHRSKTPLSGSTQVIPWGQGYLTVVHQRKLVNPLHKLWLRLERVLFKAMNKDSLYYLRKTHYFHRFITLNTDLTINQISKPYYFEKLGVEFAAGLVESDGNLVVSYGVRDRMSKYMIVPPSIIRNFLK